MHRKGNDPFRQPVGSFQVVIATTGGSEHLLAMGGYGIIDHRRYILPGEEFIQSVAVGPFQDERILMKNVMAVGRPVRRRDLRVSGKGLIVIVGGGPSGGDISVQSFQL